MNLETAAPRSTASSLPRLAWASAALVWLLLVLSADIRLRAAGLGCADWPACYGRLPAPATPWWATAAHRAAASLLGVLILALVLTAWRRGAHRETATALMLLALTLALAVLGLMTPAPTRPWVTLGNVVGAMGMLALLVPLFAPPPSRPAVAQAPWLRPWAAFGVGLLFVQIALGAWLSANYAASACPGLAGCWAEGWASANWKAFDPTRELAVVGGAIQPPADTPFIHMVHRLGAVVVFVYLGALGLRARRCARGSALLLLGVLGLQLALGLALVALGLPLLLAVAHNAGAALLLGAAVRLYSCSK